MLDFLLEKWSD